MKLIDDFFTLNNLTAKVNGLSAVIELNRRHIIYSAHFPGNPVTPGVVQLQIVNELLEKYCGRKFKLKEILDCKFLKVLSPEDTKELIIEIELDNQNKYINAKAIGKSATNIYFKLNSVYELGLK
ncbi:MAG: hypothetical protein ICV66_12270 [Chitinophagaceae bacterium]|nr:hypothetical protein [Chitinophagaceae bacterium]